MFRTIFSILVIAFIIDQKHFSCSFAFLFPLRQLFFSVLHRSSVSFSIVHSLILLPSFYRNCTHFLSSRADLKKNQSSRDKKIEKDILRYTERSKRERERRTELFSLVQRQRDALNERVLFLVFFPSIYFQSLEWLELSNISSPNLLRLELFFLRSKLTLNTFISHLNSTLFASSNWDIPRQTIRSDSTAVAHLPFEQYIFLRRRIVLLTFHCLFLTKYRSLLFLSRHLVFCPFFSPHSCSNIKMHVQLACQCVCVCLAYLSSWT